MDLLLKRKLSNNNKNALLYPMYTEKDLVELDQFFKKAKLPKEIEVIPSQKVTDVGKFIDSHLTVARANINSNTFSSFYTRLVTLKSLIELNSAPQASAVLASYH